MSATKFRKKPVVIEAMQWSGLDEDIENGDDLVAEWMLSYEAEFSSRRPNTDSPWDLYIVTLEGEMKASPGDWVIRGIQGEFYPCKPDIFEATYEEVVE